MKVKGFFEKEEKTMEKMRRGSLSGTGARTVLQNSQN